MEDGISTARIDEGSPDRFVSLRRALGVTSFGINQMLLRPGERGRIHLHRDQEEVYLVLAGRLTIEIEGEAQDLERGEMIRVAPAVRRRVVNLGPDLCILLALGGAGEHVGRDALSYEDWDSREGRPPQEVPLPDDLPAAELRTT